MVENTANGRKERENNRVINSEIMDIVKKYVAIILQNYDVKAIILFGSYAKGTNHEDSDIDIAVVSEDFVDIYDVMAILMGMTWDIDARIEPHPITKDDYDKIANPFVKEVIDTGIKVA